MGRRSWSNPFTFVWLLCLALTAVPIQANAADSEQPAIKVVVDATVLTFDVDPVVIDGTTLVPLRTLFEAMGITVNWDAAKRQVTGVAEGLAIVLRIDEGQAVVNGLPMTLNQAPQVVQGRTLVPLRFIGEATGAVVQWDGAFREISIMTPVMLQELGITKAQMLELLATYASNQNPEHPASVLTTNDLDALQGMYYGYRADLGGYECGGLCTELYSFMPGKQIYAGLPPSGGPETIDCSRDECSIYAIANDTLTTSDGESYSIYVTEQGKLSIDDVLLAAVKPAAAGTTLDDTYKHIGYNGYIGIDPLSTSWKDVMTFRADGTFENSRIAIGSQLEELSSTADTADVQHKAGKYEITGNTIALSYDDGTAAKLLFFFHKEGSLGEIQLGADKYILVN